MVKRFHHRTAHGAELDVIWTPDGLVIRLNGKEQVPSPDHDVADYVEFGMCDQARFADAERKLRKP